MNLSSLINWLLTRMFYLEREPVFENQAVHQSRNAVQVFICLFHSSYQVDF